MEKCPDGKKSCYVHHKGPILFLVFINNLDVQLALITAVKKFTDDINLDRLTGQTSITLHSDNVWTR
jgi:hypothetical protein